MFPREDAFPAEFWVGPGVPNGPARPHVFLKMGRPMAPKIGLEAAGPGPRPGPGRPIPILIQQPQGA
jgi:hypothetical protein